MGDFKETLDVIANDNGTYCYCRTQEDLATGEIKVLDFSEGSMWHEVDSIVEDFASNKEEYNDICNAIDKYGRVTKITLFCR